MLELLKEAAKPYAGWITQEELARTAAALEPLDCPELRELIADIPATWKNFPSLFELERALNEKLTNGIDLGDF